MPSPASSPARSDDDHSLKFRLLLAVDIEKYSARSAREQLQAQADLRRVLDHAAESAGLDQDLWYQQVSGDGELAVLPAGTDVVSVIDSFTQALERALNDLNTRRHFGIRLRVRLALHHGTVILSSGAHFGPVGDAPIVVSRLLDARPLRQFLTARQDRDVALVVSDSLFNDVVRTGFCELDHKRFQQVRIHAKGVVYHGYIYDPELAEDVG